MDIYIYTIILSKSSSNENPDSDVVYVGDEKPLKSLSTNQYHGMSCFFVYVSQILRACSVEFKLIRSPEVPLFVSSSFW